MKSALAAERAGKSSKPKAQRSRETPSDQAQARRCETARISRRGMCVSSRRAKSRRKARAMGTTRHSCRLQVVGPGASECAATDERCSGVNAAPRLRRQHTAVAPGARRIFSMFAKKRNRLAAVPDWLLLLPVGAVPFGGYPHLLGDDLGPRAHENAKRRTTYPGCRQKYRQRRAHRCRPWAFRKRGGRGRFSWNRSDNAPSAKRKVPGKHQAQSALPSARGCPAAFARCAPGGCEHGAVCEP